MLSACLLSLALSACSSSDDDDPPIQNPVADNPTLDDPTTLGGVPTREDLVGVWERNGYGLVVKVDNDGMEEFEFTRASCLQTNVSDSESINQFIETSTISTDKMSLTLTTPGRVSSVRFVKRAALPEFCEPGNLIEDSTPTIVFEHVWHTFNDYYAFFTERGVDWQAQSAIYLPQVTDDMTDEQLFELLAEMIDPLDDGHATLSAETDDFEADFDSAADASVFTLELTESFNQQSEFDELEDYVDYQKYLASQVTFQSVSNLKQAGFEFPSGSVVNWGTLADNIGYLNINSMFLFDETIDLASLSIETFDFERDLRALNTILDEVMADLQDTRAMVIDVRSNGGGYDAASIEIVNRFAANQTLAFSKFARIYSGETPIEQTFTTPVSNPYTGPVAVLSSQESASATEIFLMSMNALPNVTLIGDESNGGLSDLLYKNLPNEWEFSLSNEVYSDYQDRRFEVIGVPVDIKVKALSLDNIEQGIDVALNEAVASF